MKVSSAKDEQGKNEGRLEKRDGMNALERGLVKQQNKTKKSKMRSKAEDKKMKRNAKKKKPMQRFSLNIHKQNGDEKETKMR